MKESHVHFAEMRTIIAHAVKDPRKITDLLVKTFAERLFSNASLPVEVTDRELKELFLRFRRIVEIEGIKKPAALLAYLQKIKTDSAQVLKEYTDASFLEKISIEERFQKLQSLDLSADTFPIDWDAFATPDGKRTRMSLGATIG